MRSILIVVCLLAPAPAHPQASDQDTRAELGAGLRHFYAGELEAAEASLGGLAGAAPDAVDVAFYLGRVYLEQGRAQDAVAAFERAIELDPARSTSHFWLAEALVQRIDEVPFLVKLGVATRMRTAYEEAARLDPSNLEALISVARYHAAAPAMAGGSPEKAEAHLAEIQRRDPALALVTRGLIQEQLGDLDAAEKQLRSAVELDPESIAGWRELGYFSERRERLAEARDAFEKALEVAPDDPLALYEVGRLGVLISERLLAKAEETLSSYLALEPGPGPMVLGAARSPSRAVASRALRKARSRPADEPGPEPVTSREGRIDVPLIDAARVD